jgi:excisionase family DNA binding protein
MQAEYTDVADVAEVAGVTGWTVREWIRSGRLPTHRLPGTRKHRIKRGELLAFMERGGQRLTTEAT